MFASIMITSNRYVLNTFDYLYIKVIIIVCSFLANKRLKQVFFQHKNTYLIVFVRFFNNQFSDSNSALLQVVQQEKTYTDSAINYKKSLYAIIITNIFNLYFFSKLIATIF